jgi:hypothetical protein
MSKTYEQAREDLRQATQDLADAYRELGNEIEKLVKPDQFYGEGWLDPAVDRVAELQELLLKRSGAYMAAIQSFEELAGICGSGT